MNTKFNGRLLTRVSAALCLSAFVAVGAQAADNPYANQKPNERGSTTGPTKAKGYDHPNQYIHMEAKKLADNMEPMMIHKDEISETQRKLAKLESKYGKKPNVVIFLTDDVGWMDPGFNGGGAAVGNPTPNLDKFAHDGLKLTSAYSTPSCSPTRATIMTGMNPLHHGILRPPMYGEPGGLDGLTTIADVMKKLGYRTQGIGKWHMGENKGSQPQNVGFDDYYGFLGVSDMYTEWRDVYFNPEVALSPGRFEMMEKEKFSHYNVHATPKDGVKNIYKIDLNSIRNLDQDWIRYTENFLDSMKGSKQPFFLYYGTRAAHFDNYPNDDYAGKSPARTVFSDGMVEIDDVFRRLMAKLEDIGELENTLVIFGSDNGPEMEIPPHGRTPFRGGKGSSWEGGVRVPTFVYWKGVIEPRVSDGLFYYADLFNTAAAVGGASGKDVTKYIPKTHYLDGIDQSSFFLAKDGQSARRSVIYTMNEYVSAVRMDEFKYNAVVELQDAIYPRGDTGGFSGAIINETGGATATNLYTNPQEDTSVGIRHIPITVPLMGEYARYMEVFKKYPKRETIGFAGH
jgi:arylsulfatase